MKRVRNYKDQYDKRYYLEQGSRFESGPQNDFSIYFRKFLIKEPILDLGCGTGLFMEEALKQGFNKVTGLEISRYAIKVTKKKGLDVYYYNGTKIPFQSESFNTIFCFQVLEHVPRHDSDLLIKECYRVLKRSGNILIFSPAECARYVDKDPTHINYYSIRDFLKLIKEEGFEIKDFNSTMLMPIFMKKLSIFSYIISKALYKIFKARGTTIELVAYKPY